MYVIGSGASIASGISVSLIIFSDIPTIDIPCGRHFGT